MGVRNYEAGEWLVARDLFITCHYSEARHQDKFVWFLKVGNMFQHQRFFFCHLSDCFLSVVNKDHRKQHHTFQHQRFEEQHQQISKHINGVVSPNRKGVVQEPAAARSLAVGWACPIPAGVHGSDPRHGTKK